MVAACSIAMRQSLLNKSTGIIVPMSILGLTRAVVGLLLAMFLPGYMFMRMLFPRKGELGGELDTLYHIVLGILMSNILVVFTGFIILWYSSAEAPRYNTKNITIALATLTLVFFAAGWYRGAHPWLGRLHPKLARYPVISMAGRGQIKDQKKLRKIAEISTKIHSTRREIKALEQLMLYGPEDEKKEYKERLEALQTRLRKLEENLEAEISE